MRMVKPPHREQKGHFNFKRRAHFDQHLAQTQDNLELMERCGRWFPLNYLSIHLLFLSLLFALGAMWREV